MSCADCLSRRRFLAVAAGGAAVALAACGDGVVSGVGPRVDVGGNPNPNPNPNPGTPGNPPPSDLQVKVSDFPALGTVGVLVMIPNSFAAVKRTGATTFDAYHIACTHAGCLTVLDSNEFSCGCHGSRFNSSGAVVNGPATSPLAEFVTSYDSGTDILTIS